MVFARPYAMTRPMFMRPDRDRIRGLSDRIIFTKDQSQLRVLRERVQATINDARASGQYQDALMCPRCSQRGGRFTKPSEDGLDDMYACHSCGQVWVAPRARHEMPVN